jgi:hypothetical protein
LAFASATPCQSRPQARPRGALCHPRPKSAPVKPGAAPILASQLAGQRIGPQPREYCRTILVHRLERVLEQLQEFCRTIAVPIVARQAGALCLQSGNARARSDNAPIGGGEQSIPPLSLGGRTHVRTILFRSGWCRRRTLALPAFEQISVAAHQFQRLLQKVQEFFRLDLVRRILKRCDTRPLSRNAFAGYP